MYSLWDTIDLSKPLNKPLVLISVDFRKAFDLVNRIILISFCDYGEKLQNQQNKGSIWPVDYQLDPRAKHCFALICRIMFYCFLELCLYISNFLERAILSGSKFELIFCLIKTFSATVDQFFRASIFANLLILIYNYVISGSPL